MRAALEEGVPTERFNGIGARGPRGACRVRIVWTTAQAYCCAKGSKKALDLRRASRMALTRNVVATVCCRKQAIAYSVTLFFS